MFASLSLAAASLAENYSYVQWYEMPLDGIQTYGALFAPNNDHTIVWHMVSYTGEVSHAQTPEAGSYFLFDAHRGVAVQNAPLNGDLIGIVGGAGTTHHFECNVGSRRIAMPVVSVGQATLPISYEFGIPFAIASQGSGAFGFGSLSQPVTGQLVGEEGHGTLIFQPGLTSIDWTVPEGEYWHGFTFGMNIGDYRPVHLVVETGDYVPASPMSSLGGFTVDFFRDAQSFEPRDLDLSAYSHESSASFHPIASRDLQCLG